MLNISGFKVLVVEALQSRFVFVGVGAANTLLPSIKAPCPMLLKQQGDDCAAGAPEKVAAHLGPYRRS
jgi:hypothetical protein